ncbi:MAG: response regulator transcription factor [Chloroflexi bacterium]|nr:response regulator transcription factor [Chloroflexota bacterium]
MTEDRPVRRVMVVDDHPVVRDGIRAMLAGQPGIEVVGSAGSGEEAIEKAGELKPDVILMDIRIPGMSGIEATRRIKEQFPQVAVIVLTMYDSETYVVEALRAGAAGYLVKDSSRELLCSAIEAVVSGGAMVQAGLLRRAISAGPPKGVETKSGALAERLTPREMEVLRLVAQGKDNREICQHLFLAEVTVKKHVQSIMAKLGVSDRTNAALAAIRMGLVE